MTAGKILQSLRHSFDDLHRPVQNVQAQGLDTVSKIAPGRDQFFKSLQKRTREVQRAIAVNGNVLPFQRIQVLAEYLRGYPERFQHCLHLFDHALEVDVVLPQRVVGIDHQILSLTLVHSFLTSRGMEITTY